MTMEQKIKTLLIRAELTQTAVAGMMGLSKQSFSQKLRNKTFNKDELETIAKLCNAKYIRREYFLMTDGDMIGYDSQGYSED